MVGGAERVGVGGRLTALGAGLQGRERDAAPLPRRPLRARLTRIVTIQVRRLDRPSKRSRPRSTLSQASCTTSSATAWLETYIIATLVIGAV